MAKASLACAVPPGHSVACHSIPGHSRKMALNTSENDRCPMCWPQVECCSPVVGTRHRAKYCKQGKWCAYPSSASPHFLYQASLELSEKCHRKMLPGATLRASKPETQTRGLLIPHHGAHRRPVTTNGDLPLPVQMVLRAPGLAQGAGGIVSYQWCSWIRRWRRLADMVLSPLVADQL